MRQQTSGQVDREGRRDLYSACFGLVAIEQKSLGDRRGFRPPSRLPICYVVDETIDTGTEARCWITATALATGLNVSHIAAAMRASRARLRLQAMEV